MTFKEYFDKARDEAVDGMSHLEGLIDADAHAAMVSATQAVYATIARVGDELEKCKNIPSMLFESYLDRAHGLIDELEDLMGEVHPADDDEDYGGGIPTGAQNIAAIDGPAVLAGATIH